MTRGIIDILSVETLNDIKNTLRETSDRYSTALIVVGSRDERINIVHYFGCTNYVDDGSGSTDIGFRNNMGGIGTIKVTERCDNFIIECDKYNYILCSGASRCIDDI